MKFHGSVTINTDKYIPVFCKWLIKNNAYAYLKCKVKKWLHWSNYI